MSEGSGRRVIEPAAQRGRGVRRWVSVVIVICCALVAARILMNSRVSSIPTSPGIESTIAAADPAIPIEQTPDFSKFSHSSNAHSRLPCLSCHRRDTNATQQKYPGHTPCAGCHAQEFANTGSKVCAICHSNTQAGTVKSFANLRSFNVRFDHAAHLGKGRSSSQCAMCHRPERRGVSLSIPSGAGGHATCFGCHSSRALGRSGQDIASCSTCHLLAGYSRTSETSRAFSIGFSHALHGTNRKLSCASCHSIRAGLAQKRQVASPAPSMHLASPLSTSCLSCHDDKRAFGVAESSNCKKCHRGSTFRL